MRTISADELRQRLEAERERQRAALETLGKAMLDFAEHSRRLQEALARDLSPAMARFGDAWRKALERIERDTARWKASQRQLEERRRLEGEP